MKKYLVLGTLLAFALSAFAQGNNTGMGGNDGDYASLVEKVLNIEKKTDAFQVYLNYSAAFHADDMSGDWASKFTNRNLRLEIKGEIGNHLMYRLRHRLNKSNVALGMDNYSAATDIMMIGWKFNNQWSVVGGKMCQYWGGFEYDENPLFIYQYSDFVGNLYDCLMGVTVSYKPIPSQEIALMVSNSYNNDFATEWGENPRVLKEDGTIEAIEEAKTPLCYILNWNGSFLDGMLSTRWSGGYHNAAKGLHSYLLVLGQKLSLPNFQWYLDYYGEWDDLDRPRIASRELLDDGLYFGKVKQHSLVTKANWQFAPKWNLMLKGMYETTSLGGDLKSYRKSFGYMGALEYFPIEDQDLRFSLAYIGRKYDYNNHSELDDYNTNRIELGFMYRIKAF